MIVARLDTVVLDRITASLEARAARVIQSAAFAIQGEAISRAPVDTGALKNSIEANPKARLTWWVQDGVNYGIYQELGTYKMPAHPFLVPAVENVRPRFIQAWEALFK